MHLQDINRLLNLQGMSVAKTPEMVDNILVITLEPSDYTQQCPCCHSNHVIRKGNRGYRSVRHLPIFEYATQIQLPKIQMQCRNCHAYFSWEYSFVQGKSRFTDGFKEKVASDTVGSTVTHTARNHKVSYLISIIVTIRGFMIFVTAVCYMSFLAENSKT